MAESIEDQGSGPSRRAAAAMLLAVLVAAALAVSGWMLLRAERERDLRSWQARLGVVADSRAAAVEEWLEAQFAVVRDLAQNASLQLYATEITRGGRPGGTAAEEGYLRNLLIAQALHSGFHSAGAAPVVGANLARPGLAGLALLDAEGRVLAATEGMPPIGDRLAGFLAARRPGERALLDLHLNVEGQPAMGFLAPVFAIQADAATSREIGVVLGIRPVAEALYSRLRQPGETGRSVETVLLRRSGDVVEYLSPLADGTAPLRRAFAHDTPDLAAAFALASPGGFAKAVDYANREVLVTSRALAGAPWTLMRKIDAAEALAETEYRGRVLAAGLGGGLALALLAVLAAWRHGSSRRAERAAARLSQTAGQLERLTRFMRRVTDRQPTAIAVVDAEGRYSFANERAALQVGVLADDLLGKSMASVLGPARAKPLEVLNRQALESGVAAGGTHLVAGEDGERILRSDHIPLAAEEEFGGGVLMVLEDITDLVNERARRERTLKHLVATLVALIDRRDPYAAGHSGRVVEVARAIAGEMQLSPVQADTVEIAASLMNLGKIAVPEELLTRATGLQEDEIQLIRDSIRGAADLLEAVEFDGPVVETLRQIPERWDGSGPRGLAGEDILPMARIVAVANAFVGMVSARAWRPGLDLDLAAATLRQQVGAAFDPGPVAALVNVLENRGGRARWAGFANAEAAASD